MMPEPTTTPNRRPYSSPKRLRGFRLRRALCVFLLLLACSDLAAEDVAPSAAAYEHLLKSQARYLSGDFTEARRQLTLALAFDGGSAFLHEGLGRLHLIEGESELAAAELRLASELASSWWRPRHLLGEVALLNHRPQEAMAYYREARSLDRQNSAPLLRHSEALYMQGEAAVAAALIMAEAGAEEEAAWRQLLLIARASGDNLMVGEAWRRLSALAPDDFRLLDSLSLEWAERPRELLSVLEALEMETSHPALSLQIAALRFRLGRAKDAEIALKRALAHDPDSAELRRAVGLAYLDHGQFRQAAKLLRLVLASGGTADNHYFLGLALFNAGQLDAAYAEFAMIGNSDAELYVEARLNAARVLLRLGNKKRAIDLVANLPAELGDRFGAASFSLTAAFWLEQGLSERASELLARLRAEHPEDADLIFEELVWLDANKATPERILPLAEELLRRAGADAEALNYLGYSLVEAERDLPRAESLLRRACLLDPFSPHIADSLGFALYRRGAWAEARAWVALALLYSPGEHEILLHAALIEKAAGDNTAREEFLRRLAELPTAGDEFEARLAREFGRFWRREVKR